MSRSGSESAIEVLKEAGMYRLREIGTSLAVAYNSGVVLQCHCSDELAKYPLTRSVCLCSKV